MTNEVGITVTGATAAKVLRVSAPLRESKSSPTHAALLFTYKDPARGRDPDGVNFVLFAC
jgi:hypothetical protein